MPQSQLGQGGIGLVKKRGSSEAQRALSSPLEAQLLVKLLALVSELWRETETTALCPWIVFPHTATTPGASTPSFSAGPLSPCSQLSHHPASGGREQG